MSELKLLPPPAKPITIIARESPVTSDWVRCEVSHGSSLLDMFGRSARADLHVTVEGEYIPRDEWATLIPAPGSEIIAQPAPGFETIAGIAAGVAASVTSAAAAVGVPAGFAVAAGAIAGTIVGLGITVGLSVGISMAMNALIGPQAPKKGGAGGTGEVSRFFSITGGTNQRNQFGPIPKLYGHYRIYPPLAANYYTEQQDNSQFLHMLLCLSHGRLEIDGHFVGGPSDQLLTFATPLAPNTIRIGDTDISEFRKVEWQIGRIDQLTLYPNKINEDTFGINLNMQSTSGEGGWYDDNVAAIRTTAPNVSNLSLDVAFAAIYSMGNDGVKQKVDVDFKVEYRPTGTSTWIQEDGSWIISAQSFSPVRRTYRFKNPLPSGQYDVRLTRKRTLVRDRENISADAIWTALRSVETNTKPWTATGCTMMALRIKATGQLNGAIDTLNVMATSVLPVWTGQQWEEQATRNPAWCYLAAIKGTQLTHPLTDTQIDTATLQQWAAQCDTDDLEYNWYHQDAETLLDVVRAIATTGRAAWGVRDAKFTVIQDLDTPPVQLISPRNATGFSFEKTFAKIPHALRVRYINTQTWQQDERIVYADGYNETNATDFETIETQGVTSADQAYKEGRYYLAVMTLRPEIWTVSMDAENLVATRGDTVRLAHDVILVGHAYGRVKSVVGGNPASGIILDELCPMVAGTNYAVRIRRTDGSHVVQQVVTNPGEQTLLTFTATRSNINVGDLVVFGELDRETVPAKITQIDYDTDFRATIKLVPTESAIQNSTGPLPPYDPGLTTPIELGRPPAPIITMFVERSDIVNVDQFGRWTHGAVITWTNPASPYPLDKAEVRYLSADESFDERVMEVSGDTTMALLQNIPLEQIITADVRVRSVWGRWSPYSAPVSISTATTATPLPVDTDRVLAAIELVISENQLYTALGDRITLLEGATSGLTNTVNQQGANVTALQTAVTFLEQYPEYSQTSNYNVNAIVYYQGDSYKAKLSVVQPPVKLPTNTAFWELIPRPADIHVALQQETTTRINEMGELEGKYSVKIDNNGYVTGFGLLSEPNNGVPTSHFYVRADRFAIGNPNSPAVEAATKADPNIPFMVITTNQIIGGFPVSPGIYVKAAFIHDGAITNAKIGNFIQSGNFVAGQAGWRIHKGDQLTPAGMEINGGGFVLRNAAGQVILASDGAGVGMGILGNAGNMLRNAQIAWDTNYSRAPGWELGLAAGSAANWKLAGWSLESGSTTYIRQVGGEGGASSFFYQDVPVIETNWYEFSVYTGAHRCTVFVRMQWFNAARTFLSEAVGSIGWIGDSSNAATASGGSSLKDYKRLYIIAQAPANAAFARVVIYKGPTNSGQSDSYGFFARAYFAQCLPSQQKPSAWGDRPPDSLLSMLDKIPNGTYIENAIINTAHIVDAAITNAKIQNLAVDTLKLAGTAVTQSYYVSNSSLFVPCNTDGSVVVSLVIPATGLNEDHHYFFHVGFCATNRTVSGANCFGRLEILDGPTFIFSHPFPCRSDGPMSASTGIGFTLNGTRTYTARMFCYTGAGIANFSDTFIHASTFKR
jgi:hypothetical protein